MAHAVRVAKGTGDSAHPDVDTSRMATQLEIELSALRARRRAPGIGARLRHLAPFDRRAIREPDSRDEYWVNVQRRLAESDYVSLTRFRSTEPPPRSAPESDLIG
jgi:hypothetical protein